MTFRVATVDVAFTGALTATTNHPTMVLNGSPAGSVLIAIHASVVTGTSPTLSVKLQDSADGTTFADVTGAATPANITAAGNTVIFGHTTKQFVRVVSTVGGTTPSFTCSISVFGAAV